MRFSPHVPLSITSLSSISANSAVRVRFFVTVRVLGFAVLPSLQRTNLYPYLGVAEILIIVPFLYVPPPDTEPCNWLQLSVMVY